MPMDNNAYRKNIQDNSPKQVSSWSYESSGIPSTRDIYKKIAEVGQADPNRGAQLAMEFYQFQQQPNSPYYNAYGQATNQAVKNLASVGIDASVMNTDWFKMNTGWKNDLVYKGTTNTPSNPGAKATPQQYAAYQIYQLSKQAELTDKVDSEWAALQQEIFYWTNRKDLNLSDDDIVNRIEQEKQKKYPTLYAMDHSYDTGQSLLELNHGTTYSKDNMYGVIWAARNGKSTGNIFGDNLMSAGNKGDFWKENKDIAAKMNKKDLETYSPFSVGMTADDVGLYFSVTAIDDKMLGEIEKTVDWNNDMDVKMFNKAKEDLERTKQADAEKAKLEEYVSGLVKAKFSEEDIIKKVDKALTTKDYKTLKAMDDSIDHRDSREDMVQTTYAVDYSRRSLYAAIHKMVEERDGMKTGDDKLAEMSGVKSADDIQREAEELYKKSQITPLPNAEPGEPKIEPLPNAKPGESTAQNALNVIPQDAYKNAYDAKYGDGAYDRDMASATAPREPTKDQLITGTRAKKFITAASILYDKLSEKERERFGAMPGINGTQLADAFYKAKQGVLIQGPVSDKLTDPDFVASMATKIAEKDDKSYRTTSLESMRFRKEFEDAQKESQRLWDEYNKYQPFWTASKLESQNAPEKMTVTIPDSDIPLIFRKNSKGEYEFHPTDNVSFEDNFAVQEYLNAKGMTIEDLQAMVQKEKREINERVKAADVAKEELPFLSDREMMNMPTEEELEKMRVRATALDNYIKENTEKYDQSVAAIQKADKKRNDSGSLTLRNSGQIVDPRVTDVAISFIGNFTDWERPAYGYDSMVEDLAYYYGYGDISGKEGTDATKELGQYISDLDEEIKDVQSILDTFDDIPDDYRKSMEDYVSWASERKRTYEAYSITQRDDFNDLVEKGKNTYWQNVIETNESDDPQNPASVKVGWGQMTNLEQSIYYALCAENGVGVADQFYKDIEGSLLARTRENLRAGQEEFAKSGFAGRVFNEIFSIAAPTIEVPANILYLLGSAFNGEGNKWLRIPSQAAKSANEETLKELHNIYDGTAGFFIPDLVEMINNRGRSIVTAKSFGWLIPEGANDVFHAMPIATIAMADGFEEAKNAGLQDWQAWTLGTVNFLAESLTEGIKYGHYNEALEGMGATSLKEFLIDRVKGLDWLSEATGETLNNIVERWANWLVAGDKSEHEQKIRQYMEAGLAETREDALKLAFGDYIAEDAHTALVSALGSFLDVGTYSIGRLQDTIGYAKELSDLRRTGNTTTTIRDLRNRDVAYIKSVKELQKILKEQEKANKAKAPKAEQQVEQQAEAEPQTAPAQDVEQGENNTQLQRAYDVDIAMLENSGDSDRTSQTSTMAAVIWTDERNGYQAIAAATAMAAQQGDQASENLRELLEGGRESGTNINKLKLGIQYAALADGECRRVMNSNEYLNADRATKARMLADAVLSDATNSDVKAQVDEAVHESRVNEAEQDLMAERSDELKAEQNRIEEAERNRETAEDRLNTQRNVQKVATDEVARTGQEVANNPSQENVEQNHRASEVAKKQASVTREYEQSAENAANDEQTTRTDAEQKKEDIHADIRQQAEERVRQAEAQEAEQEAAKKAEAERLAKEEAERRLEEDRRTGKLDEDARRAAIDKEIERLNLKGEVAERVRQQLYDMDDALWMSKVDTSKLLSDTDAALALNALSRKLGVLIEVGPLPEGKDGMYSSKGNKITLSDRLTVGQALIEVAMHEITHSLEGTKSYQKYKEVVMGILFKTPAAREQAIQDKIKFYTDNGVKLGDTPEEMREKAEAEIVADFAKNTDTFANRDTIQRMMDAGLAGKIRNALHNVNQFLKNAKLKGDEKIKAENLRRAERLYQKAINERANVSVHPNADQFSVNQFAEAAGLYYQETDITDDKGKVIAKAGLYSADPSVDKNATRINKVTPEMISDTPVGQLTSAAIALGTMNRETVDKIHTMFADLMTMCADLQDSNLVWEIAGSTLYSEFSAIKANSDKQYSNTVDFGTICTKTQAIVNQLSKDMLRLGRGLTSQEILQVYNDVFEADLTVPCPVCYVFSRWLGVPSLLENIRQYQNRFLGEPGAEVDKAEVQRRVNDFIKKAHIDYGIGKTEKELEQYQEYVQKARKAAQDAVNRTKIKIAKEEAKIAGYEDNLMQNPTRQDWMRYKASAEKRLANLQTELEQKNADLENSEINAYSKTINKKKADIEKSIKDKLIKIEGSDKGERGINDDIRDRIKEGKPYDDLIAKRDKIYGDIDALRAKLREVDAYNWVTQALCKMDLDGNFVVDDEFVRTKDEVLLDLNRTGEFAKDVKNWTYRSTRGAGMGKAILPYSGASIGDSVLGIGARSVANPFKDHDEAGSFAALRNNIIKAKRQNLIGGQRFQSTSDFRPEWGLDYIMTFIEQQALGSNGQLYTKVNEAVPLYASVGIDTNCSIMPWANGYHEPAAGEIEGMSDEERKSRVVTFTDDEGKTQTVVLDFSDVTGMKYKYARQLSKDYDNVQMIMVGINDIHIRACLAGEEIDFVIPWHASGNTKGQLQSMMRTVSETLTNSSDYTKVQTDQIANKKDLEAAHGKNERGEDLTDYENDLIHKEEMRDARMRLITGKTLTKTDKERIKESKFLTSLYERFKGETLPDENGVVKEIPKEEQDPKYYVELPDGKGGTTIERVTLTTGQAEQIFPYEYWDTSLTKDQADENGWNFVQYCQELGLVPRFSGGNQKNDDGTVTRFGNFSGAEYDENGNLIGYNRDKMAKGYWKTLIDRKMYDNNGNYRDQQQIDASKVQAGSMVQNDDGTRTHVGSNIPDTTEGSTYRGEESKAKYEKADRAIYERIKEKAAKGDKQAIADLERMQAYDAAHADDRVQYDLSGEVNPNADLTQGEMLQMLKDAGIDYRDAVERGDMETAQRMVDEAAEQAGYTLKVYHGTPNSGRFNVFDPAKLSNSKLSSQIGQGFYFTNSKHGAEEYTSNHDIYGNVKAGSNPYLFEGYLKLQNPLIITENSHDLTYDEIRNIISDGNYQWFFNSGLAHDYENETVGGKKYTREEILNMTREEKINFAASVLYEHGDKYALQHLVDFYSYGDQGQLLDAMKKHTNYDGVRWDMGNGIEQYAVFDSSQFKDSASVTYDDNGNMIPLEQRFSNSNDIRYDLNDTGNSELTEGEKLQLLRNAGVTPEQQQESEEAGTPAVEEAQTGYRQFGRYTAQESDALHARVKKRLYNNSEYTKDTNEAQIDRAIDWVLSLGTEDDPDGYHAAVDAVTKPDFDYRSADGQARMLVTMAMAAANGNTGLEMKIAEAYNEQGTDLGRQLQARKIFRLMTPIGRRMMLESMTAKINQQYKNEGKDTEVVMPEMILKAAESAKTEEDFAKVQAAAQEELARQMPATWQDKLRTWRMLSMLANPRTHIRNIVGNLIFVPTVGMKNAIATGLESAFIKEGERTKAIKFSDDAIAFAEQDVEAMHDVLTGEAKYSPENKIKQNQKAFGRGKGFLSRTIGKGVQATADFNSWALEAEDWMFLNRHYRNALASYMTANNLTSDKMTGETLEKAREYAILEAQKATYRDANIISSKLNQWSRDGGVAGFLTDAVLPFKKTPANILRRGIEYSPVGLVRSLATAKRSLDLYHAWDSNGRKGTMPKGAKSVTQVLDSIAAGLTGTAIAGLGAAAFALGAVKLSFGRKPEDEIDKLEGSQEYSVELFGKSFTIDWAAPVCMPFFTGAAIAERYMNNDKNFGIASVIDAISQIAEPVFNLSMLDGVSSLLKSASYSSNSNKVPVIDLLQKIGSNYIGSLVPSALGAAARTIDPVRRKSFVESGADMNIWMQMLEQAQNKIPYLSMKNIPYRNVWGETSEENLTAASYIEAFIENFISPGYFNDVKPDKLDEELRRVFEQTGDKSVIPKEAGKTVGDVKLNAEQYDQYVVARGQAAKQALSELIERPEFIALTPTDVSDGNPEAQKQLIKDVWEYANAVARHELFPDYKMSSWIAGAYSSGKPVDAVLEREETKAKDKYREQARDNMYTAIDKEDSDALSTSLEALHQSGKDDKSIRSSLISHYGPIYKKAFTDGDEETMRKIENGMIYLNLGEYSFDWGDKIFDKWQNDAINKME